MDEALVASLGSWPVRLASLGALVELPFDTHRGRSFGKGGRYVAVFWQFD